MSTINDTATAGHLQLCDVTKVFANRGKDVTAVDRISLDIAPGEFITLLGPSGCGKTTTLRMVAGFEDTTSGRVVLDGEDMVTLPPNKRPMSMVFQSYALFPHMSIADNVGYGLKMLNVPPAERRRRRRSTDLHRPRLLHQPVCSRDPATLLCRRVALVSHVPLTLDLH